MQTESLMQLTQMCFVTVIQLALPVLVVAFVVAAVMSCLQTVFQIHDAALSLVPRVVVVLLTVGVTMPWMIDVLTAFFRQSLSGFGSLTG